MTKPKQRQRKVKAWYVIPEKGLPTFFTRDREEAKQEAEDICFMGSKGLPQKIGKCEIILAPE